MEINASSIQDLFESCLDELERRRDEFVPRPGKDFSCHRILDFKTLIKTLVSLEGKTLDTELINLFSRGKHIPSESAFIQQRNKLNIDALDCLFHMFQKKPSKDQLYLGFRLLAIDGSGMKILTNSDDPDCRHNGIGGRTGFNELFLHALFDVMQGTYVDIAIKKLHKNNEPRVFCDIVDSFQSEVPIIYLGDANYGTFNVMAHIQSANQFFLLRTKDITSNGSANSFDLPNSDEFDLSLPELKLTRNEGKQAQGTRNQIHFVRRASTFDYLSTHTKNNPIQFFRLPLRIVRFKIDENKYDTVFTNLDESVFPSDKIKQLYRKRWNIETSFRRLKHSIGLLYSHSKKFEFIEQEIYARVIAFNYVALCVTSVLMKKGKKGYDYSINFIVAAHLCKKLIMRFIDLKVYKTHYQFFAQMCSNKLIMRFIDLKVFEDNIFRRMNPLRPDRVFERLKYTKNYKTFMYRAV